MAPAEPSGPKCLHLARRDHVDRETLVQQRLHERPIGSFDGDVLNTQLHQALDEPSEALARVGHIEAGPDSTTGLDDTHSVRPRGPVDTGQSLHLLHLRPPLCEHRGTVGVGTPDRLLIAWRSGSRIPRAGLGAPARRDPLISCWSSKDERIRRYPGGHRGFIKESPGAPSSRVGFPRRVHQ